MWLSIISSNEIRYKIYKKLVCRRNSFTPENKYILKGVIMAPFKDHFTCYINKLNIINPTYNLVNNLNYYYDNKDVLFENISNPIIPYLCLYEKN